MNNELFELKTHKGVTPNIHSDWSRLPAELKATKRKKRKPTSAVVRPNISKQARQSIPDTEIAETLEVKCRLTLTQPGRVF